MLTFAHQPNAPHRAKVSKMLPVCAAKASAASLKLFPVGLSTIFMVDRPPTRDPAAKWPECAIELNRSR
jgi:hypothetical protein